MALTEAGREVILALASIRTHAEEHDCDACYANVSALVEALGYWVTGDNTNRAKLEEVFGEKKASQEGKGKEGGEAGQSDNGTPTQEGAKSWEDEWK